MKTIIAGSRNISDASVLKEAIDQSGFLITEVVSGTAKGVDRLGEIYADANKIPLKRIPANWPEYGRSAGVIRNIDMAKYADALIAVWDGTSKGTEHMIDIARRRGLEVFVYERKES